VSVKQLIEQLRNFLTGENLSHDTEVMLTNGSTEPDKFVLWIGQELFEVTIKKCEKA
jgi:hypothetical protein